MADQGLIPFTYKQLVTLMLHEKGITEGLWGIYIKFGIGGANIGTDADSVMPAAIVPIQEIGIQRFKEPSAITVDASTLAPKQET